MNTIFYILSAGLILTVGDLVAGEWIQKNKKIYYIISLIIYMIGLNFLIYSYKFEDIAVATVIMEIFNIVTLTVAGKFLFKENITKTEFAGIAVGIFAVIILEIA